MAEKIIFWIGALSIGLNAIRFSWVLTSVFLGWLLRRLKWTEHYVYFAELLDKRDV